MKIEKARDVFNIKTIVKLISIYILLSNLNTIYAAPLYFDQNINGSNGESLKSPVSPKMSGNTGALQYDYNFKIPNGRSAMTPDVSVSYNSQTENNQNYVGYGFSLSVPYIQRFNIKGIEHMYNQNDFTSNKYGDLIISSSTATFYAKQNDNSRAEFKLENNVWIVKDNKGMVYTYGGGISNSIVQNASTTGETYMWYLTDTADEFGNNIHYTYIKDGGMVYPNNITYTNNISTSTGAMTPGIYEVKYNWETRSDTLESYQSGFQIVNNKRLNSIDVYVNNNKKKTMKIERA